MRSATPVLLAAFLAIAGCAAPAADVEGPAGSGGESPAAPPPLHPAGTPEFCESEDVGIPSGPFAGGCLFWDEDYHEVVVYDLDTTAIDVVIVPSAGMDAVGMAASRRAVEAWEEGIRALSAPWFNASFEMNVYVVGQDVPSLDAVSDPEVIVASSGLGERGVFGIGAEPKQMGCIVGEGPGVRHSYPVHAHHGMEIRAADCTGTGFTCMALNVGGIDQRDLYDLIAHEVGHCLGIGHVGDALDFRSRFAPVSDIMSYQSDPEQVHCVSTLNVRVLEGVYAHLMGQPEETWLPRLSYFSMSPLDYDQVACENPV